MLDTPAHVRALQVAVRDFDLDYRLITHETGSFETPSKGRILTVIGDDAEGARGPKGFHGRSLRVAIERSAATALVACEPLVLTYGSVIAVALTVERPTLLVETRAEHEAAWRGLIERHGRGVGMLATVREGWA